MKVQDSENLQPGPQIVSNGSNSKVFCHWIDDSRLKISRDISRECCPRTLDPAFAGTREAGRVADEREHLVDEACLECWDNTRIVQQLLLFLHEHFGTQDSRFQSQPIVVRFPKTILRFLNPIFEKQKLACRLSCRHLEDGKL